MIIVYTVVLAMAALVSIVMGIFFGSEVVSLIRNKGVPFVPLRGYQVAAVMDAVPVTKADVVYDLGCGDGRVLRAFLRAGAGRAVGYEVQFAAFLMGKFGNWRARLYPDMRLKNFFSMPIGEATVVYIFLMPFIVEKLQQKFDAELKPGTRVVSFGFEIKNWRPATATIVFPGAKSELDKIFIYTI